ncbi:RNA polymerase II subunit A, putative [Entamoeba histolytica HM-3:IMSS]|uniref:RNA polymerase II subunit A C-terminal domain phosphatase SSU72 n=6 Tax=Entamoeba TaxID=5758 RepID=C4M1T3_ENTH1|nr:Ssu72 family protein [Entamoeba nuttalli P19]XP_657601.1 hypothetical protein, conserved [Entamoeba histolytica HM-1:IMSS]EMD44680.1 RNA polymerase II subunit A Cterminal domain phosphatase SSU72 [Entamoeba histolytica KU27]EMS16910.1 RNA polymerase II subunit A, putative [Entamoeba histolytica HM-3:IMSS]GAT95197.1 hypothetical protein conserved [Entamoeba histolytica]EAL52214.1 hypothetical protein, conserved [Entamoeba histolytica HM-1:IMSS]EKE37035.1 Ssu72 family protein [Entamoeba nutt|eukprot:XP_008860632.1 Ssu72 family protein [Entamoeba nuttalli P19]
MDIFQPKTNHFSESIAVICRSNQNRSISAHCRLKQLGYNVSSFGTGVYTILPGATRNFGFQFGIPYKDIKNSLPKDEASVEYYRKNKIYQMLDRNANLKSAPEKFQDCKKEFNIIITLDYSVFMDVLEYFDSRESSTGSLCYVFNLTVMDQLDTAEKGAIEVSEFLKLMESDSDWMNNIDHVIKSFYSKTKINVLHSMQMY